MEDDRANQELARQLVLACGCEPVVACNGEEACLRGKNCPVVLMDLQLIGGPSGYQIATELLRRDPTLYVVALTAHSAPEYERHARGVGMREFLSKPISRIDLEEVLLRARLEIEGRWPEC